MNLLRNPYVHYNGRHAAELIAPGHSLLDAVLDLILEKHPPLLKQGAILMDEADPSEKMRALLYLEHTIEDGREGTNGRRLLVSRRFQFVEISVSDAAQGKTPSVGKTGPAPYLNYRPLSQEEMTIVRHSVSETRSAVNLEKIALSFAIRSIVPEHLNEVKRVREPRIRKTIDAVEDRLTKELRHWDQHYLELKAQEQAGKFVTLINSARAKQRTEDLQVLLQNDLIN